MDWALCIICGKAGGGDLRCPLDSLQGNGQEIYGNFLQAVEGFQEINAMPVDLKIAADLLTVSSLVENRAKWHRSCQLKFKSTKLQCAQNCKKGKKRCLELPPEQRRSKRHSSCSTLPLAACIFCDGESGKLHSCTTMELDEDLKQMATKLQDSLLLSKIMGTDLVAIEAKYHINCLVSYKNRYRSALRAHASERSDTTEENVLRALVFAELVSFIEGNVENGTYLFKLNDLYLLFEKRLSEFGINKKINRTRLKDQILNQFSGHCIEEADGRNILFVFKEGFKKLVKDSIDSRDFNSEALLVSKLAKTIRKEIFQWKKFSFNGQFPADCQRDSVPPLLKSLVSMLINGQDISASESSQSQASSTISQLIYFNAKSKCKEVSSQRHAKDHEPPLPIYLGLQIHTLTRSKALINSFYALGLSVNYKRVAELEDQLASAVSAHFEKEGIVCPPNLRKGLFTIGALDNIDHNPSSTTAQGSFHGTAISIFQFPSINNLGIGREPILINPSLAGKCSLPDDYANVSAVACDVSTTAVPAPFTSSSKSQGNLSSARAQQAKWLNHAMALLQKPIESEWISWSAFHASLQNHSDDLCTIVSLLPLFYEKAATVAMIKHGMQVQKKITDYLNPGQVPIMTFDQPLFALAKSVQWKWPHILGEGKFLVMFGGLHIELALWNTIGDFLEDSGWTAALTESGVATAGKADSFLNASHLTRTRRVHQVTLLALAKLQHEAWATFLASSPESNEASFNTWRQHMISKSPTFQFWDIVMDFEIMVLIFVHAHRTKYFDVYVESLDNLVQWFFALDHVNYARWIPIHIRDMQSLPQSISEEFKKCWVVQKTQNLFSCIPLDQAHEQNNKLVKNSGGAVGLTENPSAFRRWAVAGPEQAQLLQDFESQLPIPSDNEESLHLHHEQSTSAQNLFKQHVCDLCSTISSMGNPFLDDCTELLVLNTRNCASEEVVKTVKNINDIGLSQYKAYVRDVVESRKTPIHQPIKRNSLPLFKRQKKRDSKSKKQFSNLKSDLNLFSHLYIASTFRGGDLDEFFSHENHPWPPSISDNGKLRLPTKKSDLLNLLEVETSEPPSYFDAKLIDGAAAVHFLSSRNVSTFADYGESVFNTYIKKELLTCNRIDIVWDVYNAVSLKNCTREKRGQGTRLKVSGHKKLPRNFQDFLRDAMNKQELFGFLTSCVSSISTAKVICVTSGMYYH